MFKNATPVEAIILIACIAAPIVTYKMFDSTTATVVVAAIGTMINFMLGRGGSHAPPLPQPDTKPEFKALEGGKDK